MKDNPFDIRGIYHVKDHQETTMRSLMQKAIQEVYGQREEILKAFIAKYGCEPDEVEQVEQRSPMGFSRWFVRKRSKNEIERDNQLGKD